MPAYGCAALTRAVRRAGSTPRWIDVTIGDLSYPVETLARAVKGCSAVLLVHQFGIPSLASEVIHELQLPVIEDVSTAVGGELHHHRVGGRGRVTVLSMGATKIVSGGEGGAVVGAKADLDWLRLDSDHLSTSPTDDSIIRLKMSDVCAAIANVQLAKVSERNATRTAVAHRLCSAAESHGLRVLTPPQSSVSTWWRVLVSLEGICTPEQGIGIASDLGITFGRPAVLPDDLRAAMPVSAWLSDHIISVPSFPDLTSRELASIERAMSSLRR